MTKDNKVVMFADIMGFAALIETYPLDIAGLRLQERILSPGNVYKLIEANQNRLTDVFSSFHYSLRWILDMARLKHPFTSITFSDSSFVATNYVYETVSIAIELLHSLLPQKIPVRIGIAYGSFAALRFRSDITADSGDHAAHFLGQSVVRAHIAEACGIKGLRILLHPSVMPLLDDIQHNPQPKGREKYPLRVLECSEKEQVNKVGVTHEINYWQFAPTREAQAC